MNLPIALILPYPPSDNERFKYVYVLSDKVKLYREFQRYGIYGQNWNKGLETITEEVQAVVYAYPCNNRRDLDNCKKELWDSLQAAKVLKNDHLVRASYALFCEKHPSDVVFVELWPIYGEMYLTEKKPLEQRIFDAQMHEELTGKVFAADATWEAIRKRELILDWKKLLKHKRKRK